MSDGWRTAIVAALLLGAAACRETDGASKAAATKSAIPAPALKPGRAKPIVAVIAENRLTEVSDYVVPCGVLSAC
jgi:hypothetical protein